MPVLFPNRSIDTPQTTHIDERWAQVEEFLNFKKLRPSTRRSYETWLRNFYRWNLKPWAEISSLDIQQYCDHLAKQTKRDRWSSRQVPRYSPNSQNAALITLKSFFGWLNQQSYIPHHPVYD
jgi:site-specific recombinase XerD